MIQGHVIDPGQIVSGSQEGELFRVVFRNGEKIEIRCTSPAESKELVRLLGL